MNGYGTEWIVKHSVAVSFFANTVGFFFLCVCVCVYLYLPVFLNTFFIFYLSDWLKYSGILYTRKMTCDLCFFNVALIFI